MVQDNKNRLAIVFQNRIKKVDYFCTTENISPNVAVHEIRKTFKRMRAFLKFYSHSSNQLFKACKKEIVSLGKSLALLRESYVNIQIFERITAENKLIPQQRIKIVKEKIVTNNKLLINQNLDKERKLRTIHKSMKQLEAQIGIFHSEHPSREQFLITICKSYNLAHSFNQKLHPDFDTVELHKLRKKIKALYYQLDFLKFTQPKFFRLKSTQIHNITEQLGNDHDLFVFLEDIKQKKYDINENEVEILENKIRHLSELNRQKLDSRLKQLFADSQEIFNKKMEQLFNEQ